MIKVKKKVLVSHALQFRVLLSLNLLQASVNTENMNVVITGATKGMGRASAKIFAEAGHSLIICARSEEDLEVMKVEFSKLFPAISVQTKVANMGNVNQIKDFGKWIVASGATPDILINNAGYFIPGNIYSEEEGTLQKMLEVNLNAAYHLSYVPS